MGADATCLSLVGLTTVAFAVLVFSRELSTVKEERFQSDVIQSPRQTSTAPPTAAMIQQPPPRLHAAAAAAAASRGGSSSSGAAAAASAPAAAAAPSAPPLDGTLAAALRAAAPPHRFLLLTFGNKAVLDHLRNFCYHARRAGISHVVGAVDDATFRHLAAEGRTPAYKTPLAHEAYTLDGSNSHASGSWKRFASMRTGEVAKIVRQGYDVLHTDTDVVWLRDPAPYLVCTPEARRGEFADGSRFPCSELRAADVAVSSDNMGPGRAVHGGAAYHAGGTFNSGILLFRATPSGTAFVEAWHSNVARPPRGSRFVGKTSDQQVFNAMVRKERQWPGVGGKRKEWLMRRMHEDWEGNLSLGALPLPLFANGHGYFVQRAHERLGVAPFAVHATYSLDYHDGNAKQQRFREAGLWGVDDDSYYTGRFLAVNASVPPAVAAAIEGFRSKGETPNNIGVHAVARDAYLLELRDALALANALRRTLILPEWLCYCDKLWAGSDDLLRMKCMYPGSQDHNFLPFACPMDHVLSPHSWKASGVPYRDHSFLSSPRLPAAARSSIVDVAIVERAQYDGMRPEARHRTLPRGVSAAEAQRLLGPASEHAAIVRLPHTRGLLCGVGDAHATQAFARLSRPLLRAVPWCTRCEDACRRKLPQWLSAERIRSAIRRGSELCLNAEAPPFPSGGGAAASCRP